MIVENILVVHMVLTNKKIIINNKNLMSQGGERMSLYINCFISGFDLKNHLFDVILLLIAIFMIINVIKDRNGKSYNQLKVH